MPKIVTDWKAFAKKLESEPHRWHCLPNARRSVAGSLRRHEVRPVRMLGGTVRVKQINGYVDELGAERGDIWVQWTPDGEDVVRTAPPPLAREARPRSEKTKAGQRQVRVSAKQHEQLTEMSSLAGVPRALYVRQVIEDFIEHGSDVDLREDPIVAMRIDDEVWNRAIEKAEGYGVSLNKIIRHELDKRLRQELTDSQMKE